MAMVVCDFKVLINNAILFNDVGSEIGQAVAHLREWLLPVFEELRDGEILEAPPLVLYRPSIDPLATCN